MFGCKFSNSTITAMGRLGCVNLRVLLCLAIQVLFHGAQGGDCPANREQPLHNEAKLHNDLLCAYHPTYRPVKDHKSTVTVMVRFALKYISFDTLEETFNVHSWVAMMWNDEYLTWNPADYDDINEIQLESSEIWSPSMALLNADVSLHPSDLFDTTCLVSHEGKVTCVPHIIHSGICRTSLRRWPYDVQNCTMYFGSWMHTGEQVNFTFFPKNPVILEDYNNGPGWFLMKVVNDRLPGNYNCCPNNTYPMLKYTFMLKREAAGPAAIVIVPSIVVILLTMVSLLLDVKDNVRLMVACFSLFGHFIFLTEIGYDIPKHSADTPIILLFVRDSMVVTLTEILATLYLMSLRRKTTPAPVWIVRVTRLVANGPGKYVVFTEFDPNDCGVSKPLSDEVISNTGSRNEQTHNEWIQFANLLNSCIFIISALAYLVLICVYIPFDD